ncbi:hypothetical protein [Caulifigura coniformis]|uniref:hypothetical protein n=1 Tax=Caulifigura coniformis TaxID=2527983 RepID=UPI00119D6405|nr:hypothetical protein [Caulifigura coniformis]
MQLPARSLWIGLVVIVNLSAGCRPAVSRPTSLKELQESVGWKQLPADAEIIGGRIASPADASGIWILRSSEPLKAPPGTPHHKASIASAAVIAACGEAGVEQQEVGAVREKAGFLVEWALEKRTVRVCGAHAERGYVHVIEILPGA